MTLRDGSQESHLEVDFFTLALGPSHHQLTFKTSKGKALGTIQYDIRMNQLSETKLIMKEMKCEMFSIEGKPFQCHFRSIMDEGSFAGKIDSNLSNMVYSKHKHGNS